jgi:hypothetical protein
MDIDRFTADLIYVAHIVTLLFILIVPFTNNQKLLTIEFAALITIMFHWITNNQVCCLTEMEKILRNETNDDRTFFGKLVGPVYSFGKDSPIFQVVLISLIMITAYKVKPYEALEIKKLSDVFTKWRT